MRALIALTLCFAVTSVAAICQTTQTVAFVNPTEATLEVQVNQRAPFEVPAGGEVRASVPALDRLTPISITARDARGSTVFFQALSLTRLESMGNRVELAPAGEPIDPFTRAR